MTIGQNHCLLVVILEGKHVHIMFVFIGCLKCVCLMRLSNDSFEKLKGEKRTWANPMGSKQWKSLYEIDNFTFLFVYVFFRFLKKYEK